MTDLKNYLLALTSPEEDVVLINRDIIKLAIDASRKSPRKRIISPFINYTPITFTECGMYCSL